MRHIVLTWILVMGVLGGLEAQRVNPFELFSSQDSISGIDQDTLMELDTVSNDTLVDPGTAAISETTDLHVPDIPELVADTLPTEIPAQSVSTQNPFELREFNYNEPKAVIDSVPLSDSTTISEKVIASEIVADSLVSSENDSLSTIALDKPDIIAEPSVLKQNNMMVFLFSLFSCLLLSILFTGNRSVLSEIQKSLNNMNYMKLFQKEERNGRSVSFLLLYIIYIINAGVFVRFCFLHYQIPAFNYNIWVILLVITVLVLLRHLSLSSLAFLRKKLPDATNYSFIITMINGLIGLILIPINLLIAYGPESFMKNVIMIGLVLIVSGFLFKWFKGFLNSVRIVLGDSFHFLLYLCTCEIVPILICVGFLRNLIN